MKTTIAEYRRGIASLHNLMNLLQTALVEVMPSAVLARTGAHGWRGFVIRSYQDLACGHYFCQINRSKPAVMILEEFYNYGGFHYPWKASFDLTTNDFFGASLGQQRSLLIEFYRAAVAQALEWQNSAERHAKVPEKIWNGKVYINSPRLAYPKVVYGVTNEYISALDQQDMLLASLIKNIEKLALQAGLRKPYFKYNQSGWNYRGLWMKLRLNEPDEVIPEGSFPYKLIFDLYDQPAWVRFLGNGQEIFLDLEEQNYFLLDEESQQKTVTDFITNIMPYLK